MTDNYDDYEEEFDQDGFKWMSMVVLVLAVTGFFSLAWYAYQNSTQHLRIEDVLIVEADDTPIKRAPEEAGGMEFPHKDKAIYSLLDENGGEAIGGTGKPKATAEEEAVDYDAVAEEKAMAAAEPNKNDRGAAIEALFDDSDAQAVQAEKEAAEKLKAEMAAKEKAAAEAKAKAEREAAAAAKKAKEAEKVATYVKPTPKAEPRPFEPPVKKEVVKKETPKPAPKPVKKAEAPKAIAGSGDYSGYAVQLGAVRSQSEAEALWKKVRKNHIDLLSDKGHKIIRADLGEKGVYYRLRVGGLSSAEDAKALCAALAERSQGCFPAGKI